MSPGGHAAARGGYSGSAARNNGHPDCRTSAFNPAACPLCASILRLPLRRRYPDFTWTMCGCGYQIARYPCGHTTLLDVLRWGDPDAEPHECPPPLSPWRYEETPVEEKSAAAEKRRTRDKGQTQPDYGLRL